MQPLLGRPRRWSVAAMIAGAMGLALTAVDSQAMTFAEAYAAATQHDAQYRAAAHELETSRLGVPVARAALLPLVTLNAATAEVTGRRQFPNSLNQDVRVRVDYATPQASLSLRMPIFNYEATSRLGQAQAQSEVAESLYRQRGQELLERVAAAYMTVLVAEEGKRLAEQQVQALTIQRDQLQRRFQRGEGTRIDVAQSQAALDVAQVRVIEADDQLDLAHRQLRRVTGVKAVALSRLPADYVPPSLLPEGLHEWLTIAARQSPALQAREQSVLVARMGVQRNRAAHLPRVDLVASVSRSQNESISNLNQTSSLRSVGVQLNVPIYSGGGIDASVRQALSELARAEEEVRAERENLEVEVQRQYQGAVAGADRVLAYRRAVESSELALTGTRRAFESGLSTASDIADAQARYFSTLRDLAQVRIDYLIARTRLMLVAGTPMSEVAEDLHRTLTAATTVAGTQ